MDEMNQMQNQGGNDMPPQNGGSGLGVASMVLGIISLVLFCIPYVCIPGGIISIVLGGVNIGKNKPGKEMAIAGVVCSIIAIAVYIILTIIGASILDEMGIDY